MKGWSNKSKKWLSQTWPLKSYFRTRYAIRKAQNKKSKKMVKPNLAQNKIFYFWPKIKHSKFEKKLINPKTWPNKIPSLPWIKYISKNRKKKWLTQTCPSVFLSSFMSIFSLFFYVFICLSLFLCLAGYLCLYPYVFLSLCVFLSVSVFNCLTW